MFKSLSGRFLLLTIIFVMLAEVFIFVPSVARFREDFLMGRLERAQIASLALLADEMISPELEEELLTNAGVFNVVLRRDVARQLVLSSPMPEPVAANFDLRDAGAMTLIRDALARIANPEPEIIRVIGNPLRDGGILIEVTMESAPLRAAMIDYGLRILALSLVISLITAVFLFLAVRVLMVQPIKSVVANMRRYAEAPEDVRRVIRPTSTVRELREAEDSLMALQTQLTSALKQKDRLAQLGGAVARVSHDLRNILTSAQLFTDRIEMSEDPAVMRMAPKLVNSITRAVHLCESTLAFGKAEEPPPTLMRFNFSEMVADLLEAERIALEGQDITLVDDVPPNLMLRADQEQLYRVVLNLVRNARQALQGAGQGGEVAVHAEVGDNDWIIRVCDNGLGLPAKAREHLFQPFQGAARKGGTGLGLAIVAELVRGHGGTLTLVKSDETGTEFEIRLPMGDV